jgi:hypothetical protein
MALTQLKNILSFTNLAPATPTTVPHGLNQNGAGVVPDFLTRPDDVSVVATATDLTVTNNGAAPATFNIYVERWHTTERQIGAVAALTPQPFQLSLSPSAGAGVGSGFVPQAGPTIGGDRTGIGIFVNPVAADAADDGNVNTPKLTIAGALACIPAPTATNEQNRTFNIFIAAGNYDESIVLPTFGLWVNLIALGHVTLGNGTQPGGGSTLPRNITWTPSNVSSFGASHVTLSSLTGGYWRASDPAANGAPGWRISGNITMGAGTAGTACYLNLASTFVEGNVDTSAFPGSAVIEMRDVRVEGAMIFNANTFLAYCNSSFINVGIEDGDLGLIRDTVIIGNVDLSANPTDGGEWINCELFGSFIQNAGGVAPFMDKLTARSVATTAGALVLGPTPTEALHLIGQFGAANIGAGIGSVFLPPGGSAAASTATDDWQLLVGNYIQYLAGINVRIALAAADGDDFAVEVLANGAVVASIPAVSSLGPNSSLVNLSPMVPLAANDAISVRIVKGLDIGSGAINITVALFGY